MLILIFYKGKDGINKLREFEKGEDALKFLLSENVDISLCEMWSVDKKLKLIFVDEEEEITQEGTKPEIVVDVDVARGKEDPKCSECGRGISGKGKTGLCQSCIGRKNIEERDEMIAGDRKCERCKKTKISSWNKSGFCRKCGTQVSNEKQKLKIKKEKKEAPKGKCRRCKKEFKLEKWQHSTLHWCPECRKTPGYKTYMESAGEECDITDEKNKGEEVEENEKS